MPPLMPLVEMVSWMKPVEDADGKIYLLLGSVINMEDTIAVTPKGGSGGTLFFCQKHLRSYKINDTCEGCRTQVVNVAS